ncbi:hypothetical protein M0804_008068 [Polistes exclamans]|nr:hypothetical protein M0804_008068 [Polistes exclamans]
METLRFTMKKESCHEPWGFSINGGADFAFPVTIVKIRINGLAFSCGLRANDVILLVNGKSICELESTEVAKLMIDSGNNLELIIRRFKEVD